MRCLIVLFILAGCASPSIPFDGCEYWRNKPYSGSQQPWRHFDCPAEYPQP